MNFFSSLVGGGVGSAVDAVGRAADALFTSDEEREKAKFVLEKLRQEPQILQAEINKLEAGHRSLFVAGWRPFVGWICASGVLYHYILRDMLGWAMNIWITDYPVPPPLDLSQLMTLLLALLGIAGYRTVEKLHDKAR